jgi:hypothetical protein
MHRILMICALAFAAGCGDDGGSSSPPDAPSGAAFGAACTTVSNTSTECTSGVCTNSFDQIGHPVCSQQCTFGMNDPCPVGASGAKMCNMKGYCKP